MVPLAILILCLQYFERLFSGLGIKSLSFYFPGLGILVGIASIYILGLLTTTLLGKIFLKSLDRMLHNIPALGRFYSSIKEILGYGTGNTAFFQESVLVCEPGSAIEEIGFITNEIHEPKQKKKVVVFIPDAPNLLNGRIIVVQASHVTKLGISTSKTFKALVGLGKGKDGQKLFTK